MRTLLALVVAVAMVAGAMMVRERRHGGPGDAGVGEEAGGEPVLLCATEVAAACERLAEGGVVVRVEPAGASAQQLSATAEGDGAAADAWLVPAPWPAIVEQTRDRAGLPALLGPSSAPLARSPVVVAVWEERAQVLREACSGGQLTWRCLGRLAPGTWADAGGDPSWGPVKPGHPDPATSATGLLVLAQATASYLQTTGYSARDLDDDGFRGWLTGLERAVPTFGSPASTPLQQALQFGASKFDAVGALESEAVPLLARSAQRRGSLALHYLEPAVTADVVLAPLSSGGRSEQLTDIVAGEAGMTALADTGWRVGTAAEASEPPLPPASGLPEPGVLVALLSRWSEATR